MKKALILPIAALVIDLALLAFTLPLFLYFRGKDVEIPLVMVVLVLVVLGLLSAQISMIRKGKLLLSQSLTTTALVQAVVMIIIQIFIFIALPQVYDWFPAVATVLVLVLIGLLSAQVHVFRKAVRRLRR